MKTNKENSPPISTKLKSYMRKGICEAGVDEVGRWRGCLAGPVVAAAVILPEDFDFEIVKDSKQLSEKKRNEAVEIIKQHALHWAIASVSAKEIDDNNILQATFNAMGSALNKIQERDNIEIEHILIDGNRYNGFGNTEYTTVIKGDATYYSIAAASILAKVARDNYMKYIGEMHPVYEWSSNKGYGSKKHRDAIVEHGVTEYHRISFLGNILPKNINKLF